MGAHFTGRSLKSCGDGCGVHTLGFGRRWELGAGRSLLIIWLCAKGGVYCEKVSAFPTHFHVGDVGIFSFTPSVAVTQGVSELHSERTALCVAVDLVCQWEEVTS